MDRVEDRLAEKSAAQNPMVANLIKQLGASVVYSDDNFHTNQKLWNAYAGEWNADAEWVVKMAKGSQCTADGGGSSSDGASDNGLHLEVLGDEWSRPEEVLRVVREWTLPYVTPESALVEIGCGGGRIAAQVAHHVRSLDCWDVSANMLKKAEKALSGAENVKFSLLAEPRLPRGVADGAYDFVYCFDVLVHVDLHVQYAYYRDVRRLLKPGGKAFFSVANLLSPLGWRRFEKQAKYSVGGFYFVCPEMVRRMVAEAGLRIVRESEPTGDNVYYDRDFLFLVEAATGEPMTEAPAAANLDAAETT